MEKTIFSSDSAFVKYVEEEDDLTSIDYQMEVNDEGDFIGGDFLFDKKEVFMMYNFASIDDLVEYCKHIIKGASDVKQMWQIILDDFKSHYIDVSPDEYEGGQDFMTNI